MTTIEVEYLVIGAGAVGIAYGWYLARGGDDVAYLVKPKHAADLRSRIADVHEKNLGDEDRANYHP